MEGRDKGKHFLITEMSAAKAEDWGIRAFLALANSGVEIPEEVAAAGMAGIAIVGLRALGRIKIEEARPLLQDMMECVQYLPDPTKPAIVRGLIEVDPNPDIEEPVTRLWLRAEVFELHTGFSIADAISTSQIASATAGTSS